MEISIMDLQNKPRSRKSRVAVSACNRCKQQHIRCDGEHNGLPCSNCRRAGNSTCKTIKTQRSRARSGRFVTTRPYGEVTKESQDTEGASLSSLTSSKSIQLPEFFVDLPALCNGSDINEPEEDVQRDSLTVMDRLYSFANQELPSLHSIWGESWYLSLIVRATNSEDDCLWQPISQSQGVFGTTIHSLKPPSYLPTGDTFRSGLGNLPSSTIMDQLIEEYFNIFHLFCPIIRRQQFLDSIKTQTVSPVLLRCVLFIASIHCDVEIIHKLGYKKRIEAEDDLFHKARTAFDTDSGSDRLEMLQSCYLLHYWSGKPNTYKDSLWWLAGAIRSAQAMGMHKTAENRPIHPYQRGLRRRIWWLLYIRDRQISLSLGKPMQICDDDCDIEFLIEDDFVDDSKETMLYVMAQARLSISASNFLRNYLWPLSRQKLLDKPCPFTIIGNMFMEWYNYLPVEMQYPTNSSSSLVFILNMTYHYYEIILYQTMLRCSRSLSLNSRQKSIEIIMSASQKITTLVENVLISSEARAFPMICVSAIFAATTAQYTQSRLMSRNEVERQILLQSVKYKVLALKEFEHIHILAHWIRQLFVDALREQPTIHPLISGSEKNIQQRRAAPASSSGARLQAGDITAMHSKNPLTTPCVLPTDNGSDQFSSQQCSQSMLHSMTNEDNSSFCDSGMVNQGSEESKIGPLSHYDFYSFEQLQCNLFDLANSSNLT